MAAPASVSPPCMSQVHLSAWRAVSYAVCHGSRTRVMKIPLVQAPSWRGMPGSDATSPAQLAQAPHQPTPTVCRSKWPAVCCREELRVEQFPLQLLNEYASRLMYQVGAAGRWAGGWHQAARTAL